MRSSKLKCLFGFLFIVFIFAIIPSRITYADTIDSGSCGENITWSITDEGVLTISGSGSMTNWNTDSIVPWYKYRGGIQSVVISDDVTSIGGLAFYECNNLQTVTFPNTLTSIGKSAFYNCTSLTDITFPNSLTSIGNWAFQKCTSLKSVTIPGGVSSISTTFLGCTNLTSVTISDGVTTIGSHTFNGCSSLVNVVIPNSVTSIGGTAFFECTSLKSIVLPDNLKSIGDSAFNGCTELSSINIPNSVTSIGNGAFSGCSGLSSINIPNSVTSIGTSTFARCKNLTEISIPNGVTSIGSQAFYGCTSLSELVIPNSVTSIEAAAFCYCTGFKNLVIPNTVTTIGHNAFASCTNLTSITLPNGITSIEDSVFERCTNLTTIIIPQSVTSIGSSAFYLCKELKTVEIPNSVTTIGNNAFSYCEKLTGITIPDDVTKISNNTFEYCRNLRKITLPSSVTSIGENAFYQCEKLTGINIPDGVTTIGSEAFAFCTSITSISLPDGVTTISDGLFHDCNSLTTIKFSSKVSYIGDYAFSACTSLIDFTIPDTVTSIGQGAFYYCEKIKSITIPDGITTISDYTFEYCSSLNSVTLPESLSSIGNYAFSECTSLSSIIIPVGVSAIGDSAFVCYPTSNLEFVVLSRNAYNNSYYAFYGADNAVFHCWYYVGYSNDGNGSVSGKYLSYGTDVLEITVNPKIDYYVDKVTISYSNKTIEIKPDKDGKYKYTMPELEEDVYIEAAFLTNVASGNCGADLKWTLDDRGTLTISGSGNMTNWYSADFVPWKNYKSDIKSIVFSDSVTSIGSYAFYQCNNLNSVIIPRKVTSIGEKAFSGCTKLLSIALDESAYNSAAFSGLSTDRFHFYFDVSYTNDDHGTITGKAFSYGTDILEFTVTPKENYEIDKVIVAYADGEVELTPDSDGKYVHTMLDSKTGVEVKASFRAIVYEIRVYGSSVGSIWTDMSYASFGDEITVHVIPNQGYELDTVYVNGEPISGTVFKMPAQYTEVTTSFKKIQYSVTVAETTNGTVKVSKDKAGIDDKITVTVTPSAGYELDEIRVNDKAITENPFKMPANDVVVSVSFIKIEFSIAVGDIANGSVKPSKSKATIGDEITLEINPGAGFDLDTIKVNGSPITGQSFTMPAENVIIDVTFIKHDLMKVESKAATCTEDGHKEYFKCSRCNKLFSDSEGKKEISAPEVIKALGHDWDEGEVTQAPTCESGGIKTLKCKREGCNETTTRPYGSPLDHSWDEGEVIEEPTCENAGTLKRHCTRTGCTETKTEPINPLGHKIIEVAEKAPTKTEPGNIKHYKCERCGKLFSDAKGKNPISKEQAVIPAMGHNLSEVKAKAATCTEPGNSAYYICKDDDCKCGKAYSDPYGQDKINIEDTVKPALGHNPEEVAGKEATCTEDGYEKCYECSRCNKLFSDADGKNEIEKPATITKLGHNMKHIDAKKPTHEVDGNYEYYHCDRCGKDFDDEEGKTELTDAQIVDPHIGAAVLGEEITDGDFKYMVTNPRTDGTGTVTIICVVNEKEAVVIPSEVELKLDTYKVTRIGPKAFYNNKTIKTVNIGAYVTIIDSYAFAGCSNLTKVTGGTRVQTLGSYAFANCSKLSSFTITSSGLKKIGTYVFNKDKKLKTLNIRNTTKLTKSGVKKSLKGSSVKIVRVKKSKVKKYKKYFTKKNCGRKIKVKK